MSISKHLKEIGRGAAGARALGIDAAHALMAAVLDGEATDLEVGAFVMAMRMKGETLDELVGFLAATEQRCLKLSSRRPVVLIPSYNGARRLPNLTPLLAMCLSRQGARVLVHGPLLDPARVTSASIFHDLGLHPSQSAADVESAWARCEPAFMATGTLSPALQTLLQVRAVVGLRNSGHTVAKMLDPFEGGRSLRLVNFTHPEFGALMKSWAQREAVNAILLRGTEGEPVADPRRQPRIDAWIAGEWRAEFSVPAHEGVVTELPLLPPTHDAATTALYIREVLSGERPAPAPLTRQVDRMLAALAALDEADRAGS